MANPNEVNINLKLQTTGLEAAAAQSKAIKDNLDGANTSAGKLGAPKTLAIAKTTSASTQENIDYGVQRSIGGTGSASRDFAQQAQGLGGLVHLYATFAANLFAADAAFRALSDAVNTSHLITGLDQIGIQSGKNLTSLAQQLNAATDGALSLKQSFSSIALASSAGLSSDQILRMGMVAKQASQALGWDMTDALDRLTKGIAKNRPQLLDELGILVNVNTVYSEYALSVGKSSAALTDFEKKQAFANAVLDQGAAKFSAIDIPTNPYVKIEAGISNLLQSGLTLVNTVLGPLVNLLSSSPTALATVLTGITAMLVKQAIPAIGAFRENAEKTAAAAGLAAGARYEASVSSSTKMLQLAKSEAEDRAQAEVDIVDAAEKRIQDIKANGARIQSRRVREILSKDPTTLTETDFASMDRIADRLQKTDAIGASAIRDANEGLVHLRDASLDYQITQAKILDVTNQLDKAQTVSGQNKIIFDRANQTAALANISNLVAEKAQVEGFSSAIKAGFDQINKVRAGSATVQIPQVIDGKATDLLITQSVKGINVIQSFGAKVGVVFTAATGAINTALNAFGPWIQVIGLAVAALGALASWASTNDKQMSDLSATLESVATSGKLVAEVSENIAKQPFDKALNSANINAVANSFDGLAVSIAKAGENLQAVLDNSSGFDKFSNGFKSIFGQGVGDDFSKNLSGALGNAIKGLEEGPSRDNFKTVIGNILNIKDVSTKSIRDALQSLDDTAKSAVGQQLAQALDIAKEPLDKTAQAVNAVDGAFKNANTSFELLTKSISNEDVFTKFGTSLVQAGIDMQKAFESPQAAILELNSILKDTSRLSLLPVGAQEQLLGFKAQLTAATNSVSELNKQIKANEAEAEKLSKFTPSFSTGRAGPTVDTAGIAANQAAIAANNVQRASLLASKATSVAVEATIASTIDKTIGPAKLLINEGIDDMMKAIKAAQEQAGIVIQHAIVAGMSGTGTASASAELARESIDSQISLIEATLALTKVNVQSNLLQEAFNATQIKTGLLAQASRNPQDLELLAKQDAILKSVTEAQSIISSNARLTSPSVQKGLDPIVLSNLLPLIGAAIGAKSKEIGLQAQRTGVDITEKAGTAAEQAAVQQKDLQYKIDSNKIEQDTYKILIGTGKIVDSNLINKRMELELKSDSLALDKINLDNDAKIAAAQVRLNNETATGNAKLIKAASDNLALVKQTAAQTNAIATATKNRADNAAALEANIALEQNIELQFAFTTKLITANDQLTNAKEAQQKTELSYLESIGAISTSNAISESAALDKQAQQLTLNSQIRALTEEKRKADAKAEQDAAQSIAALPVGADTGVVQVTKDSALAQNNELYAAQLKSLQGINDEKLKGIDLSTKQNMQAADLAKLTTDLVGIFGTMGTAMSGVVKSFEDMAVASATNASITAKLADNLQVASDTLAAATDHDDRVRASKDVYAAEQAVGKQNQINTQSAIKNDASLINSTKNLFGQKTQAYKVLNTVEKAVHIESLAMDIAKNASTLLTIPGKIAAGVSELFAQGGWVGFAGAAAFLALMAGLGFAGGGKSNAPPKGFTAEERQAVQGTGQTYNAQGKLVETGGGVLGDPSAKMTSVVKSLDSINSTTVANLSFSNQMVDLLSSINDGINKGAALLASIPGLRSGSSFGTTENSNTTNNGGINAIQAPIRNLEIVVGSIKDLFSKPSNIFKDLLSSLPGSKSSTSTTIVDSGIKLSGTLSQLAAGVSGTLKQFENDVVTSKSSSLFGLIKSSSTTNVTQTQDLNKTEAGKKVQDFFTQVFSDSVSLLEELGNTFGKTKNQVDVILQNIPISAIASLKGLSGDDFTNALAGLVNDVLDKASKALFGNLISTYQKVGESSLETLTRIADDNYKVNLALQSMGDTTVNEMVKAKMAIGSSSAAIAEASIAVSEALVTGAGSLSNFLSQASNYGKNFLTDAQRLIPVQNAVNKGLADLGLTGINTRDKFAAVVAGLDLTTEAGQKEYQALMNISDAFAQVYVATNKSLSVEDMRVKSLNNEIAIQKALGNVYQSIVMQRQEELYQLSLYPKAQADVLISQQRQLYALQDATAMYSQQVAILAAQGKTTESLALQRQLELAAMDDRLRPGQIYINALNDEAALVAKITTARDKEAAALNTTLTGLKGYITTLQNYKNTLANGSSSILTDQQKYTTAKDNLYKLQAIATGPATTPEQIASQAAAVNGLSSAADTFLQTSQTMFASSDKYTMDYQSVMKILDDTTSVLGNQETDAQKQLDQLTSSTMFLDTIAGATQTTADLLTQYYAQQGVTFIAANNVPTSADTSANVVASLSTIDNIAGTNTSPTYTPTTNQTANTILSDQLNALTSQIAALQAEVAGLRADANAQTGDLLASNAINSDAIVTAIDTKKTIIPVDPTRFGVPLR